MVNACYLQLRAHVGILHITQKTVTSNENKCSMSNMLPQNFLKFIALSIHFIRWVSASFADTSPYSATSSVYYGDHSFRSFPRHFSLSTARPDPIYGLRPRSRDPGSFVKSHPSTRCRPQESPAPAYPDFYAFSHMGYNGNEGIYYEDDCSTCYGDYIYDDYGSYYSSYGEYYPPQPIEPPPVYTPTPSRHSNDLSLQQFSTHSHSRNARSKEPDSTWFPIEVTDDYSTYMPNDDYSLSYRCRSMPDVASVSHNSNRCSVKRGEIQKPVKPEVVPPPPREARKLSRSRSWSNTRTKSCFVDDKQEFSSFRERSHSLRNYTGYHSGDLRGRTSHTSEIQDDLWKSKASPSRKSSFAG